MTIIRYDDVLSRPIGIGEDLDISFLDWIRQQIYTTNDGIIRVRLVDVRKIIGPICEKKTDDTIYLGLRYALVKYGIDVRRRTSNKDGTKILILSGIKYE